MDTVRKWEGRAVRWPGLLGMNGCFIPSCPSVVALYPNSLQSGSILLESNPINSKSCLPGEPQACGSAVLHLSLVLS